MSNLFQRGVIFKDNRKELIFSGFVSLLGSGLDFSRSFLLLINSQSNQREKEKLKELYDDVVSGYSLYQAMERSGCFSSLDWGVVRIGEQTGKLTEALTFLADYYREKIAQRRMVSSAVSYPIVILCTAVGVVIFMLIVIVPMFEQVYQRMGGELPVLTRWVIDMSESLPVYLAVLSAVFMTLSLSIYMFRDRDSVQKVIAALLLNTPFVGDIVKKKILARFCKLLYLLIASGVPLLTSIGMLESIITLFPYRKSFAVIVKELAGGGTFSGSLTNLSELYDKRLITLISVGEQTNRLPQMLCRQGEELTKDLEFRIRQLGTVLEPALIILVGCLVAVVLISMYLPMFKLGGVIN